jgi:hypothetical protein
LTGFPAPRIVAATSILDNYSQGESMSSLSLKSGAAAFAAALAAVSVLAAAVFLAK